jgi:hypothetical protein
MKWLTAFLCVLAIAAIAQESPLNEPSEEDFNMPLVEDPDQRVIPLPFVIQCTPIAADEMLNELYNEQGFLEGDASLFKPDMKTANGKMRMFVDPERPRSWTIMIEFGPSLHCMVMSGENLEPMIKGDAI